MKRRLAPLIAVLVLALTACGWTGTGVVTAKEHRPAYTTLVPMAKGGMISVQHPECWILTVRDAEGVEHSGCVRSEVWDAANVGKPVTLSGETKP